MPAVSQGLGSRGHQLRGEADNLTNARRFILGSCGLTSVALVALVFSPYPGQFVFSFCWRTGTKSTLFEFLYCSSTLGSQLSTWTPNSSRSSHTEPGMRTTDIQAGQCLFCRFRSQPWFLTRSCRRDISTRGLKKQPSHGNLEKILAFKSLQFLGLKPHRTKPSITSRPLRKTENPLRPQLAIKRLVVNP